MISSFIVRDMRIRILSRTSPSCSDCMLGENFRTQISYSKFILLNLIDSDMYAFKFPEFLIVGIHFFPSIITLDKIKA